MQTLIREGKNYKMKVLLKNAVIKKILIVLVMIIMVSNFIMPNYVCAANKDGNKLVNGFFYLLAWGGDAALSIMQKVMMGTADLDENGEYAIKYSPGIIFSNIVPALDIDFIGADESYNDTVDRKYTDVENESEIVKLIEKSNINKNSFTLIGSLADIQAEGENYGLVNSNTLTDLYIWEINEKRPYGQWTYWREKWRFEGRKSWKDII